MKVHWYRYFRANQPVRLQVRCAFLPWHRSCWTVLITDPFWRDVLTVMSEGTKCYIYCHVKVTDYKVPSVCGMYSAIHVWRLDSAVWAVEC
jgi:hypothetical protein